MLCYLLIYNKIDACPEFYSNSDNSYKAFMISATERRGIAAVQAEILAGSSQFLKHRNAF